MKKEYLIKIDEPRIQETCDAYFKWKDLNTYVKSLVSRGINMPDAISEPMGCYCLNLLWNKASGGDAQTIDGKKIEFKAEIILKVPNKINEVGIIFRHILVDCCTKERKKVYSCPRQR